MRIVVTGASGFVGRGLIAALTDAHDLTGIDTAPLPAGCRSVQGDLGDCAVLAEAFRDGCDALVHLATVPGGAAETDPQTAQQVNLDASIALIDAVASAGTCPRVVFASSIAVFGDPLPPAVNDATRLAPRLLYGAHKAMIETWLATQSRRGAVKGLSLRLPGIVARPMAPSGMKSAFMSEVFHALRQGDQFVAPVSGAATMWLMSRDRLVTNLIHALNIDGEGRAVTLPALRVRMEQLVAAIASATRSTASVRYTSDRALEAAFGAHPPLSTPAADALGFNHDGDVAALVVRALSSLEETI